MNLSDLHPGQLVRGPTGTVYTVLEIWEAGLAQTLQPVAILKSPYPLQRGTGDTHLTVDQVALDRFVPFTGDQHHE